MTSGMFKEWLPTLKRNLKDKGGIRSFYKIALGDFFHVAEIFPSSPWACNSVVKHLKDDHKVVVEYGPGNGVVTRQILNRLPKKAKLITIEVNEHFIPQLERIDDERLKVIHGDVTEIAQKLRQYAPRGVDAIISGIPFSFIPSAQRAKVVEGTKAALKEGGKFILYQNSKKMRPLLNTHFGKVDCFFEPRNIFPYYIMVARREAVKTDA